MSPTPILSFYLPRNTHILKLNPSLNWKTTLKFPPHPKLSAECTDLLASLLCEPEDRLGSNTRPGTGAGAGGGGGGKVGMGHGTLTMRGKRGLGDDGSEGIKRHSWFRGVDWESKSVSISHYHPSLQNSSNPKASVIGPHSLDGPKALYPGRV
jgi:protein-serine/threonine kinase